MSDSPRTLARFLSRRGVASRSESARWVAAGRVEVNGRVVRDPLRWIDPERDRVRVDGHPVRSAPPARLFLHHKERGVVVTTRDPHGRATVYERLPSEVSALPGVQAVGRLDRASRGLLLFTTDRDLGARLLGSGVAKRYRLKLRPPISEEGLQRWRHGLDIGDATPTAPAEVFAIRQGERSAVIEVLLREGRNRQLRRCAERLGCQVEWLVRTAIGPLQLTGLAPGETREATPEEWALLLRGLGRGGRRKV